MYSTVPVCVPAPPGVFLPMSRLPPVSFYLSFYLCVPAPPGVFLPIYLCVPAPPGVFLPTSPRCLFTT